MTNKLIRCLAPLLTCCLLGAALAAPVFAKPAAAPQEKGAVSLRLSKGTERHIRERHFPGGKQTRGKSVFNEDADLAALLAAAASTPPRRQANGRDKRVVNAGKPVGTDGRSRRPVKTYVVISEPDGLVITAYPGE